MKTAAQFAAILVRPEIRAINAYHVAPATGMIKLDAMENPYRLPEPLRAALGRELAEVAINRYPDASGAAVKAALRATLGIDERFALILGNGSDELIQIVAVALARPGAVMLAVEPSFVMYKANALLAQMRYVGVPLLPDFTLDTEAVLSAIAREAPSLIFLAYPNNPTGNLFPLADIERIVRAAPGLVVIDEAYHPFARVSFAERLAEFPNAIVMRTLSKLGLAGIRLGYAFGDPAWIAEFDKARPPYNLNSLTQAVALTVLKHADVLEGQAATLRAERDALAGRLAQLPRVQVFSSAANFLLVRVPDANATFARLKDAGILIKNLHGWHPLLEQCLRLSIGTPAENAALLGALQSM
ncbi:MAG: histidinol-phosphate transaminase [Betaproteobacteria bacterium]|nr:histidinol-phosphate transaminase [Betaproteobacteria bacterium]